MSRGGPTRVKESSSHRRLRWLGIVVLSVGALASLGFWVRGRAAEARWQAIRTAIDRKRWTDAESMLGEWVKGHPGDGKAWLNLGSVLGILGRPTDARDAFRR